MPKIAEDSTTAKPVVLLTTTKHLSDIEVDYGHENLDHSKEAKEIAIKYEEIKDENGARWRTTHRFESGRLSVNHRLIANTNALF